MDCHSHPVLGKTYMRDTVFLSHANPEDNEFTMWLALQLRREGYPVWCDLVNLVGGETSWKDIEVAIRNRVIKFVYVVSSKSNHKEGCFRELQVATNTEKKGNLKDFVIPVRVDDLAFEEFNILLSPINAIDFYNKWGWGLKRLLEKLEKDKIPRKAAEQSLSYVANWWKTSFSAKMGILDKEEVYLSNWFEIKMPDLINFHKIRYGVSSGAVLPEEFPYPVVGHSGYIISFAPSNDLVVSGRSVAEAGRSFAISTDNFIQGRDLPEFVSERDARNLSIRLLRICWERFAEKSGLLTYEMANGVKAFYTTEKLFGKKMIMFNGIEGKTRKALVGYKTIREAGGARRKRFWHFALSAKPVLWPCCAYALREHVAFSYDGVNIWTDSKKMHRARRSQCKGWWNDDWRDRMLLLMDQVKGENTEICIEVGSKVCIRVSHQPIMLTSPVSYKEPEGKPIMAVEAEFEEDADSEDAIDEDIEE